MTMFGASIKDGVLAFNQFSWGVEKLDVFGIALGVGLDIYDSIPWISMIVFKEE